MSVALDAIRTVLAAYRSTDATITQEQITAAWSGHAELSTVEFERNELAACLRLLTVSAKLHGALGHGSELDWRIFHALNGATASTPIDPGANPGTGDGPTTSSHPQQEDGNDG